ncbi:MAG: hypothetical protein AAFX40_02465, partial [Cyanobacteria bacterium J06639_1]
MTSAIRHFGIPRTGTLPSYGPRADQIVCAEFDSLQTQKSQKAAEVQQGYSIADVLGREVSESNRILCT